VTINPEPFKCGIKIELENVATFGTEFKRQFIVQYDINCYLDEVTFLDPVKL